MTEFKCKECGHLQTRANTTIKIIDGEVRMTGDTCEKCGGRCELANPKKGVPGMSFTDSGTGKKKVL